MTVSCRSTRRSLSVPIAMSTTNATAAAPTTRASLVRKVRCIRDCSLQDHRLDPHQVTRPRDLAGGAGVLGHVAHPLLVGLQLGWGYGPPRENHLLPVTLHRRHRAVEHILGEAAAHGGVAVQVDGPDRFAARPAGAA